MIGNIPLIQTENIRLEQLVLSLSENMYPIKAPIEARFSQKSPPRCILFDIYGTLFISDSGEVGSAAEKTKARFFYETLSSIHSDFSPDAAESAREAYFNAIHHAHAKAKAEGISHPEVDITNIWKSVFESLQENSCIAKIPNETLQKKAAIIYECLSNPVFPMPGIEEVFSFLREKGVKLGVVSNAQFYTNYLFPAFTDQDIYELGFSPSLTIFSYQQGRAKPDPSLFYSALNAAYREFGIEKQDILYIGNDMLNDMWTAAENGIRYALFAGDKRSLRLRKDDSRCKSLEPEAIFTDLRQIKNYWRSLS